MGESFVFVPRSSIPVVVAYWVDWHMSLNHNLTQKFLVSDLWKNVCSTAKCEMGKDQFWSVHGNWEDNG